MQEAVQLTSVKEHPIIAELSCPRNVRIYEESATYKEIAIAVIEALTEAMAKPKKAFRVAALKALTVILPSLPGNFYSQVSQSMLHALETAGKSKPKVTGSLRGSIPMHNNFLRQAMNLVGAFRMYKERRRAPFIKGARGHSAAYMLNCYLTIQCLYT